MSLIAIDIGSSSVKVVRLNGSSQKKLRTIGIEDFPPDAIVNGEIQNSEAIAQGIRNILAKSNINTKWTKAAISVGGADILLKRIVMTPSNDSDLSEQVYFEAQQHFQEDLDNMYLRWHEIPSKFVPKDKKAILLVGAKNEAVEQKIALIKSAGIKPSIVDCDILCTSNMFEHNYPVDDATVAVINVGASATQVIILHSGEYLYSREFYSGGNEYTNTIAQSMNLDEENAESLKIAACTGDKSIPSNVQELIQQVNENLVTEIKTTIDFYFQNEDSPPTLEKVDFAFLVGGAARSIGLDACLAANLGIQVQIVNPFQRINVQTSSQDMNYLLAHGSVYGVAVGLGLRKENDTKD